MKDFLIDLSEFLLRLLRFHLILLIMLGIHYLIGHQINEELVDRTTISLLVVFVVINFHEISKKQEKS